MKKTGSLSRKIYYAVLLLTAASAIVIGCYNWAQRGLGRGLVGFAGLAFLPLPWLVCKVFRLRPAYQMDSLLLLFIFLAFQLGTALGFYTYLAYYDLFAHFLCGFVFTEIGLCVYLAMKQDKTDALHRDALVGASFSFFATQFASAMWEIWEYLGFLLFGHDSQNVAATGVGDTMEDIMICMAGSLVMAVILYFHMKGCRRFWVLRPVDEFYRVNCETPRTNETPNISTK